MSVMCTGGGARVVMKKALVGGFKYCGEQLRRRVAAKSCAAHEEREGAPRLLARAYLLPTAGSALMLFGQSFDCTTRSYLVVASAACVRWVWAVGARVVTRKLFVSGGLKHSLRREELRRNVAPHLSDTRERSSCAPTCYVLLVLFLLMNRNGFEQQ